MRYMWKRKKCGCVKTPKMMIRCERHAGKSVKKRTLAHFDADGIVRRG